MNWNEKIDLVKQRYPESEFSVPHLRRKKLLRQVETKFVGRPVDYYDLNTHRDRFTNWWDYLKPSHEGVIPQNFPFLFEKFDPRKEYWLACELGGDILIYKGKLTAFAYVLKIAYSYTRTFHLIHLKFDYMLSCQMEPKQTSVKICGDCKPLFSFLQMNDHLAKKHQNG